MNYPRISVADARLINTPEYGLLTYELQLTPEAIRSVHAPIRAQMILTSIHLDPSEPIGPQKFDLDLDPTQLDESWGKYLTAGTKGSSQVREQIGKTLKVSYGWNGLPITRDELLASVWPASRNRMKTRQELWSLLANVHLATTNSFLAAVRNTFSSAIANIGLGPDELNSSEERFAKDAWDQQQRIQKWEKQYRAGKPLNA